MRNISILAVIIVFISSVFYSFAEEKTLRKRGTSKAKIEDKKEKKKENLFGASVGYSISSDFADERAPRLYEHGVDFGVNTSILPYDIGMSLGGGLTYNTLGGSIYEERSDSNGIHMSDVSLSISKSFKINSLINKLMQKKAYILGEHSLSTSLSNTFPTSDSSRYEGRKSTLSAGVGIGSSYFDGRYSLSHHIGFTKVFNTYSYSPVSGKANPNYMTIISQNHSIDLIAGFSIGVGISFKYTKSTDGFSNTSNTSYGNSASLGFGYKNFNAGLSYFGGGHVSNSDKVELWYTDKTRSIIGLSMGYSF